MRVWVLEFAEPLPIDPGKQRIWRAGLLCRQLAARGHEVVWWTSGFDHFNKATRPESGSEVSWIENVSIRLLETTEYSKNVSFRRFRNHTMLGRRFRDEAASAKAKPDLIVACHPIVEGSFEAVRYGGGRGIPVVVDIRDQWPRMLVEQLPRSLGFVGRLALSQYFQKTEFAFRKATALVGPSAGYIRFGCELAGGRGIEDTRVVPMVYDAPTDDAQAATDARDYWESVGVKVGSGQRFACFIGSFLAQKAMDLETALEGFLAFAQKNPEWKLVLCGAKGKEPYWRERYGKERSIIFAGWRNAHELWELMRIAEIGVLPYKAESHFAYSIPNKAVEYLAGGCLIATGMGGSSLEQMLEEHNVLRSYREHDKESVIGAFEELMSLGEAGRARARNVHKGLFSVEAVYGEYIDWLEALGDGSAR